MTSRNCRTLGCGLCRLWGALYLDSFYKARRIQTSSSSSQPFSPEHSLHLDLLEQTLSTFLTFLSISWGLQLILHLLQQHLFEAWQYHFCFLKYLSSRFVHFLWSQTRWEFDWVSLGFRAMTMSQHFHWIHESKDVFLVLTSTRPCWACHLEWRAFQKCWQSYAILVPRPLPDSCFWDWCPTSSCCPCASSTNRS